MSTTTTTHRRPARAAFEATDPNSPARRAASGIAAGKDVLRSRFGLERDAVADLLRRMQQLRGELSAVLLSASSTEFRRFTAQTLIAQIDALIAQANADLIVQARRSYTTAQALGSAAADEPLAAARLSLSSRPGVDVPLIQRATDVTADLLTIPMQQFRNDVAARIRRAAAAGESSTDQIRGLSRAIDDAGFSGAAFKAERIVRTELGRVFTGANFDRMVDLADRMPFIRKGWRRTRDNRTRQGHVEAGATYARGQGIPVRDLFQVPHYHEQKGKGAKYLGTVSMRYPLDPDATPAGKLAAGATIMCRCSAFLDFNLEELEQHNAGGRSRIVTVPPTPPVELPKEPKAPRMPRARRPVAAADLRAKVNGLGEAEAARQADVAASLKRMRAERARLEAGAAAARLNRETGAGTLSDFVKLELAAAQLTRQIIELQIADKKDRDAAAAAARRALYVAPVSRRKIETALRPGAFVDPKTPGSAAETKKRIKAAIAEVEKLTGHGAFGSMVRVDRSNHENERAFANRDRNGIYLSRHTAARTVAHEIGHVLEFNSPDIRSAAQRFLDARTVGETPRKLSEITGNTNYRDNEIAKPDRFADSYIGKVYDGGDTEIVSMGLEKLFADPIGFAKEDPDYFDFMVDLLRGRFRP